MALAGGLMGQIGTLITFSFFWQFGAAVKNIANHDNKVLKINKIRKQLRDYMPLTMKTQESMKENLKSNVKSDLNNIAQEQSYKKQLIEQYSS